MVVASKIDLVDADVREAPMSMWTSELVRETRQRIRRQTGIDQVLPLLNYHGDATFDSVLNACALYILQEVSVRQVWFVLLHISLCLGAGPG